MPDLRHGLRDDVSVADGAIEISAQARKQICELAALSTDGRETGGLLLGRGPNGKGLVEVEIAGEPGPSAIRKPAFFLRDLDHARSLADEAWDASRAVWVGEWHTHPDGSPFPSRDDFATYLRLLAASELAFSHFVSVIVTPDRANGWSQPRLWSWLLELCSADALQTDLG